MPTRPELTDAARADLVATFERDPDLPSVSATAAVFQGISGAVQAYRIGHWLWER